MVTADTATARAYNCHERVHATPKNEMQEYRETFFQFSKTFFAAKKQRDRIANSIFGNPRLPPVTDAMTGREVRPPTLGLTVAA